MSHFDVSKPRIRSFFDSGDSDSDDGGQSGDSGELRWRWKRWEVMHGRLFCRVLTLFVES